ncbi:hypothetical protein Ae717Ps2_6641c [Pseudonocardia sp. Ae717_Ps2]|nr:hypothetical protein Ae717Ps2_6599c [Pseudonocardia sp. Ae717_Ps2]OLM28302.1 hypothetical protein Ae717Ps2_6641c [Pseudonocardia sp. Ae717_Ps2]
MGRPTPVTAGGYMPLGAALHQLKELSNASQVALQNHSESECEIRSETFEEAARSLTIVLHHIGALAGEVGLELPHHRNDAQDEWADFIGALDHSLRASTRLRIALRGGESEIEIPSNSGRWIGPH